MSRAGKSWHAGDIIDGYNPKDKAVGALEAIATAFDALGKPHWHMIGNHCLYNLSREVGASADLNVHSERCSLACMAQACVLTQPSGTYRRC
jgi:hypothetical protein